jgi:anti-anti-sigma regulatory factor
MLLLLRDFAGGDQASIRIRNCNNDVRRILTISNFEQLFTIE